MTAANVTAAGDAATPPVADAGVRRGRIRHAAAWTFGAYAASQVIRFGSNLVLTRLLYPEAFGMMSLVLAVLQGLQMFSDIGIGPSIIQSKRGADPGFLNTAWTIQVIRGAALSAVCAAAAPWIAHAYAQPELASLLTVAGLTAFIAGLNSHSLFVLNRDLRLGHLTLLELGSQVLGIATMLAWAFSVPSVWSLVAGSLTGSAARALGSHFLGPERCRLRFDRSHAAELLSFGRWIFLSTVLTFLITQGDRLILGKLVTLEVLGIYGLALSLAQIPRDIVSRLQSAVLFPHLSQRYRDGADFAAAVRQARGPMLWLTGASCVLAVALGPDAVTLLYDARYHDAGWMLQLLSVAVFFQLLEAMNGCVLLAAGRASAVAVGNVWKLAAMILMVPPGYFYGAMVGVIVAIAVSDAIRYAVSAYFVSALGAKVIRTDSCVVGAVIVVGVASQMMRIAGAMG